MSTALEKLEDERAYYTYGDYLSWDGEERYEIINGEAYLMASPSVAHQAISRELLLQFGNFLQGKKPCQVFAAPLDVRLFPKEDNSDKTVVQPDILVVCDKAKLADNRSCRGAPDLVIEILSPSNTSPAMFLKFCLYLEAGVREYWLINLETKTIQRHVRDDSGDKAPGRYIATLHHQAEALEVSILPGLRINCAGFWEDL